MLVATWNVNSIRARLERVLDWLESRAPDVVLLQELKCTEEQFPHGPIADLGYNAAVYGQKTYNGVAILAREPLADVRKGLPGDGEARVIGADVGPLQVVSVYVVNGQEVGSEKYAYKLEWLGRLADWLREQFDVEQPFCLGGDFNVALEDRDVHDPELWREKILCSTPEREAMRRFMDELGLVDVFRRFHEEGGLFTWWDYRQLAFPKNYGLRLDYFLVSPPVVEATRSVEIDREARKGKKPSDHAPVLLDLDESVWT